MAIENLIRKAVDCSDSTLFIELDNNYGLIFEKENEFVKYSAISNLNNDCFSDTIVVGKGAVNFSKEAKQKFRGYKAGLPDPMIFLKEKLRLIHNEMIAPLEIKPVHKRNFKNIGQVLGLTLTYPIAVPATAAYLMAKKEKRHGDGYLLIGVLSAPYFIPTVIKDLISPSQTAYRITRTDKLLTKPDFKSPALWEGSNREFNLKDIGDSTGNGLGLIFPNQFELYDGFTLHHKSENKYASSKYFLSVDDKLREEAEACKATEENEYKKWREFKTSVNPEELKALLRKLKFSDSGTLKHVPF